jgi:hypothetical protein
VWTSRLLSVVGCCLEDCPDPVVWVVGCCPLRTAGVLWCGPPGCCPLMVVVAGCVVVLEQFCFCFMLSPAPWLCVCRVHGRFIWWLLIYGS